MYRLKTLKKVKKNKIIKNTKSKTKSREKKSNTRKNITRKHHKKIRRYKKVKGGSQNVGHYVGKPNNKAYLGFGEYQ